MAAGGGRVDQAWVLVSPDAEIGSAVRVYAGYLVAAISLAIMLLVTLGLRSAKYLARWCSASFAFDAGMDGIEGRWTLVPGVLIFAAIFSGSAARLSAAILRLAAWRAGQCDFLRRGTNSFGRIFFDALRRQTT
jgi:hypothetical protein